jgi:hypothetical protein
MTGALVMVALATAVAGCATTGTPSPGGFVTNCKDIDLSNVSLEPTALEAWEPRPIAPGFLRIHYRWEDNAGPVYAIGILYKDLKTQTVEFIVGPLPGFPDTWTGNPAKSDAPRETKDKWITFFKKLRGAAQSDRTGDVLCAGQGCGMPPDSPPPDFLGTGSSGSSGGYAALSGTSEQMYAQSTRPPKVMSDAVFGASTTRVQREQIVKDLVKNTCHGVQAHLGKE